MSYFDGIVGQESTVAQLSELVSRDRLPHSLLFFGEEGLGKRNMAIALASTLIGKQVFSADGGSSYLESVNQARREGGERSKKVEDEGLPVYVDGTAFWIRPMKRVLKIEQWQTLVHQYLNVKAEGRRVVIVEDFQTANAVMANAMLKTIEEPPADVFFIILTSQRYGLLPTIISRCMLVPFVPLSDKQITEFLMEQGFHYGLERVVSASRGNPALALQLARDGAIPLLDLAMNSLEVLAEGRRAFTRLSLALRSKDVDELMEWLGWLRTLARDMLALLQGAEEMTLQCPLFKQRLVNLLPAWPQASLQELMRRTLDGEDALRLHIKTSLVLDGLIIGLQGLVKEERI